MLEKEFVPYEQALALKELGFDNTCHAYYSQYRNKDIHLKDLGLCNRLGISEENVLAPLYQQAFRWFRENYETYYTIEGSKKHGFRHFIYFENEQTHDAAELDCLRNLIEIV
jgi:hypothetical protein